MSAKRLSPQGSKETLRMKNKFQFNVFLARFDTTFSNTLIFSLLFPLFPLRSKYFPVPAPRRPPPPKKDINKKISIHSSTTVIPGRNWKRCLCKVSEGINKVYCGLYENGENQKLLGPSAPTCKITGFRALEKRGYGAVHCCLNNRPWRGWRGGGGGRDSL